MSVWICTRGDGERHVVERLRAEERLRETTDAQRLPVARAGHQLAAQAFRYSDR